MEQNFKNPIPVVVCLVPIRNENNELKLLGIIRNIEPKMGEVALPGGYIDEMERIETALVREMNEETGLITKENDWSLFDNKISPNNRLLLFSRHNKVLEFNDLKKLTLNDEVQGFCIIDENTKLAFPLHQEVTDRFLKEQTKNIIKNRKYGKNN